VIQERAASAAKCAVRVSQNARDQEQAGSQTKGDRWAAATSSRWRQILSMKMARRRRRAMPAEVRARRVLSRAACQQSSCLSRHVLQEVCGRARKVSPVGPCAGWGRVAVRCAEGGGAAVRRARQEGQGAVRGAVWQKCSGSVVRRYRCVRGGGGPGSTNVCVQEGMGLGGVVCGTV